MQKKKQLDLKKNDIIFVSNPSIFSEKTVTALRSLVTFLIYSKKPPEKIKSSFICINADQLNLRANENFAIVNKKVFDHLVDKQDLLQKVINEYRQSRKII